MAYEYEKENIRKLNSYNVISGGANITKPIEELQEVYRKAEAWDNYISDVRERVKITVNTDDDIEKETQEVIDYYMEDE